MTNLLFDDDHTTRVSFQFGTIGDADIFEPFYIDILEQFDGYAIMLQNRVRNISSRLESSKAAVAKAAAARYGPQRTRVARPATQGLYVIEPGTLAVRRGVDGPSIAFWNVAKNEAVYLKRSNKNWVLSYGPDAGKVVQLNEHWTPGGLKR